MSPTATNLALALGAIASLGLTFWGMDLLRGREAGEDAAGEDAYGDWPHEPRFRDTTITALSLPPRRPFNMPVDSAGTAPDARAGKHGVGGSFFLHDQAK